MAIPEHLGIHDVRHLQNYYRDLVQYEGIGLRGWPPKALRPIIERAEVLAGGLEDQHAVWIDDKKAQFATVLTGITDEELNDTFYKGLKQSLLVRYRLFKASDDEELRNLGQDSTLLGIIGTYALNFQRGLAIAQQYELTPREALKFAYSTYFNHPKVLPHLCHEYPEFSKNAIIAVSISYRYPEAKLAEYRGRVVDLTNLFPYIGTNTIRLAVTKYKDPQDALRKYQDRLAKFRQLYPDIPKDQLRRIVFANSENTDQFLQNVQKAFTDVTRSYGHFSYSTRWAMALHFQENAMAFSSQMEDRIPALLSRYPDLSRALMIDAFIKHPKNPEDGLHKLYQIASAAIEKFPEVPPKIVTRMCFQYRHAERVLKKIVNNISLLQAKYPEVHRWIVVYAACHNPNKPEVFIDKLIASIVELKKEFPEFEQSALESAFVANRRNVRQILTNTRTIVSDLSSEFPGYTINYLTHMAIHRRAKTRTYLLRIASETKRLEELHPDLPIYVVRSAAIRSLKDVDGFINRFRIMQPILRAKYPQVPPHIITSIQIHRKHPDEFLQKITQKFPELQDRYPQFRASTIWHALRAAFKPEDLLRDMKNRIEALHLKYPTITPAKIEQILIYYGNNSETYIKNIADS